MCGIAGLLDFRRSLGAERLAAVAAGMSLAIPHRGPDDEGVWTDDEAGVALSHRRLSIIELSDDGHEPMLSADGRYVLVFNGEIYNHRELRDRLDRRFRGGCDAETLVEAVARWGLRETLERADGMFAFAVWDRQERLLSLARDRLGEKPLYYGWVAGQFLFGSELKALRAHPNFDRELDRDALTLYLRHTYVPAPWTIYDSVRKFPAGSMLTVPADDPSSRPQPTSYWSVLEAARRGLENPLDTSEKEAVDELEELLLRTVRSRMLSDVPVGAFLSGGIDSSSVVALMQEVSKRPVRTFTIGVREQGFDEAGYAAKIASHLGTDHTEVYVTADEARGIIPELPRIYDEPFADSSQIPTTLVSDVAAGHVKVALSGDGGDEVFGGYVRYQFGETVWDRLQRVPAPLRSAASRGLRSVSADRWDSMLLPLGGVLPRRLGHSHPGEKLHKLADVMMMERPERMFQRLVSFWHDPSSVVIGGTEPGTLITDPRRWGELEDFVDWMMYADSVTYLPDDILTKVDRASMSRSLEVRVPLLAPEVVEFAWRLPRRLKIDGGIGKVALRRVLHRHVPAHLVERPKHGFGVPIGTWLRGPLREWGEELLGEQRLKEEGVFHPGAIRKTWMEHQSGTRDLDSQLWSVLMFQAWWQHQVS